MNTAVQKSSTLKRAIAVAGAAAVTLAVFGFATVSNAQSGISVDTGSANLAVERSTDLKTDVTTIINYGLGFVGILAVAFLLWGAVQYIISSGDPSKLDAAKNTIIYAIVGIIITILAFTIVNTVANIL